MAIFKKVSLYMAFIILIMISPAFSQNQELPLDKFQDYYRQIADTIEKSIFYVLVETSTGASTGSAFLVANGYLVTNGHVVSDLEKDSKIYVISKQIKPTPAKLVSVQYSDDAFIPGSRDLALLQFTEPENSSLVPMTFNLNFNKLDWVSAWGYPGLVTDRDLSYGNIFKNKLLEVIPLPVSSTNGNINAVVQGQLGELIVHSAQISSGNSGGPLVNFRGEIVGINTWSFNTWSFNSKTKRARTYLAQPSTEIVAFLYSNGVNPRLKEGQILPSHKTEPAINFQAKFDSLPHKDIAKIEPDYIEKPKIGKNRNVILGPISFIAPENWNVEFLDETSVVLSTTDNSSSMLFITEQNGIYSLKEIANIYSSTMGGTSPRMQGKNNNIYLFSFEEDGVDAFVVIRDLPENKHLFYCIVGDISNGDIEKILSTLKIIS
ncbi:MAG: serine protease [Deltaproteobacteria bacterium]|jgi:hypothetical protein|nr:serine protease [Deltaproteobacteria bacterium]